MKAALILAPLLALAACGAPPPSTAGRTTPASAAAVVDPAQLYCKGTGGTVVPRTVAGRRADLCRLRDGRTVAAADWLNSHNDL